MKVTPIKTPLVYKDDDLFEIIKTSVKHFPERSILAVASKIVSLCEGRVVKKSGKLKLENQALQQIREQRKEKHEIVKQEAEYYIDPHSSKYHMMLTIKENHLAVNAGIDESNIQGENYLLWPKNPQKSVNTIWKFLRKEYGVKDVGVVMTDSRSFPLEWGVVGMSVAHCGFKALYDCRGKKDLFGREMRMEQVNVAYGVAGAATLEMGEVNEQTPLALVENIRLAEFVDRPPTEKELQRLHIKLEDDVYEPLLSSVQWKQGVSYE